MNVIFITIVAICLKNIINNGNKIKLRRFVLQWISAGVFVVLMFFWLNIKVPLNLLIMAAVLCYLMTIVNGNWALLLRMVHSKSTAGTSEHISHEELFSYTHDPATNLPTQQQALKNIEVLLKKKLQIILPYLEQNIKRTMKKYLENVEIQCVYIDQQQY